MEVEMFSLLPRRGIILFPSVVLISFAHLSSEDVVITMHIANAIAPGPHDHRPVGPTQRYDLRRLLRLRHM